MRLGRAGLAKCLGSAVALLCSVASAGPTNAVLHETRVSPSETGEVDHELAVLAQTLDRILREGAQDLGLQTELETAPQVEPKAPTHKLDHWTLFARLTRVAGGVRLELSAVRPDSLVLLTREEPVTKTDLEMKAVTMLRDLVSTEVRTTDRPPQRPAPSGSIETLEAPRSDGRAILALNTAALGGYLGYATQRASGSSDARLQYPLTALGAGLGLGASMLVADEWDISSGRAWFLSAGILWPGASGFLLAEAYDDEPNNRYLYGLGGAMVGLTLATTTVALTPVDPGQAALAHSGGVFGTALGGLTEAVVLAKLEDAPTRGMGFGAGAGVIIAGALSTQLETSATRVLFVDLSASLGALTGAALGTPLLFVGDEVSDGRSRAWFLGVVGGTLLGAAAGVWMTSDEDARMGEARNAWLGETIQPYAGLVGMSSSREGGLEPVFGAGLQGTW